MVAADISFFGRVCPEEDLWTQDPQSGPTSGYGVWAQLQEEAGLNRKQPLSIDEIAIVEKKATEVLRRLDPKDYVSFCKCVAGYADSHLDYKVFSDFPRVELARERYPSELNSLDRKINFLEEAGTPASWMVGVLAFATGAVGVGMLADAKIDHHYIAHVLTAAGAVVSGLVGGGVSYLGFSIAEGRFDYQKRELGERMKEDLTQRVQQYLSNHQ